MKSICPLFGLLMLAGCGLGCPPDACEKAQVAISQLSPVALSIQNRVEKGVSIPQELSVAYGQEFPAILPLGATLSTDSEQLSSGYILTLPDEDEIEVVYLLIDGRPNLSFEYFSRWGRDTCSWQVEEADWLCFRR